MSIIIDNGAKRQFVRDYKLPIQIFQDEYFDYYLELFQEHFKSKDSYELLKKTINEFGSLEAFNEESKRIREIAVDFVREQKAYKDLSDDKLVPYNCDFSYKIKLYNQNNVGKKFVSIDLVKGNVQALNFYNKGLLEADTYVDFLSKFTDKEYFMKSKQIRQVIFGNLLPKKQQKIQKFMMSIVRDELLRNGMDSEDICAASPDEIVFEYEKFKNFKDVLNSERIKGFDLHVDVFTLKNIREDFDCFIKEYDGDKGIEIKNCNSKFMPEVIKSIKGEELVSMDLCFFDEGRIATYNEPLFYKKIKED